MGNVSLDLQLISIMILCKRYEAPRSYQLKNASVRTDPQLNTTDNKAKHEHRQSKVGYDKQPVYRRRSCCIAGSRSISRERPFCIASERLVIRFDDE